MLDGLGVGCPGACGRFSAFAFPGGCYLEPEQGGGGWGPCVDARPGLELDPFEVLLLPWLRGSWCILRHGFQGGFLNSP